MDDTTQAATESTEATVFADGDLGRIQGILFGDHARRVDERLATLEQALLGAIADLRGELQSSFQALEKRVSTEETNRAKAMKNLGERLDSESEVRVEGESAINHKIDITESNIRTAIAAERVAAAADVEREFATLRSDSVDRRDLAELFAATAERLRGADE